MVLDHDASTFAPSSAKSIYEATALLEAWLLVEKAALLCNALSKLWESWPSSIPRSALPCTLQLRRDKR